MTSFGETRHRADWAAKAALWQKRVAQWERSGLGQAAFCQQRRLAYATFQAWRRRLREEGGHASPALKNETTIRTEAFIPVNVKPPGVRLPTGRWACELLGRRGVKIRLRERPSVARMRQLVDLLGEGVA